MSLNDSFSIGLRGIQTAQAAMSVISHNIANVNTLGYSRQVVELGTTVPSQGTWGSIGSGVNIQSIARVHDSFIGRNLVLKSSLLAKYEAQKISMDALESIYNESMENGINESLSDFWNSWQDVADNPEGNPERMNLMEKATTLANSIKYMRSDMDSIKSDINRRIEQGIIQANTLIQEIAAINEKIVSVEAGFQAQANDLRDKREHYIKDLAGLIDINYFEDPASGAVFVVTPKGTPLVEENTYWSLKATADLSGDIHLIWERGNGGEVDITESIGNGSIGGWLELRDSLMDEFYAQFDAFTEGLIKEINRQHSQGVGLSKFTDITSAYDIQDYARYETELQGDDNDIVFTAQASGEAGDDIRIEYVKGSAPNTSLSISTNNDPLTGVKTITITLATNSSDQIITKANEIIDLVNSDVTAGTWVEAKIGADQNGQGVVTEMAAGGLNRHLSNLLVFGEEIQAGSFDVITYDSLGNPIMTTITVNPDDTREDIIAQISNIDHLTASVQVETGGNYIRIQSDPGYEFAFGNDNSSALMALGLNTFFTGYDTQTISGHVLD
ncbi:MAG: flagellar hook-associated protein FlgK, partial [Thermodesulfobacteriota bacterium]|nr:flagellar hook-associated protein FlgK [Thermodesulfobacteriota bacterium]